MPFKARINKAGGYVMSIMIERLEGMVNRYHEITGINRHAGNRIRR